MPKKILLFFLFFTISIHTKAEESIILFGVEKEKEAGYYYLGHIAPLQNSKLGAGYVQRFWLDYNNFNYNLTTSNIDAKAKGVSYALGYQNSLNNNFSYAGFIGAGIRNTDLSPNDPGNKSEGTKINPMIIIEAEQKFNNFYKLNFNASSEPNVESYWSRLRFSFGETIKVGPEFTMQGDPSYDTKKMALFISDIEIGNEIKMGAKIGQSKTNGSGHEAFIGIEFVKLLK
ncbi:MAG: cellulose biosynthesis protein BcsS [Candidatus Fonsibacter lacus]|jgi:hypothetical protein|uniref:Cellulose biosynthesis protein BcsS n=1 Tax=Candidatus Fonsibacter lacus TaxID=2576439 RepID=A0A964XRS7_9PROT|nr:cellulose biosynthesis protein BcsS [Candidatus Fonsibacter lacus]NCU48928.1 cellulose biosynthesis protein BcsS [Candidatus Fonsibacter lacus]